MVLYGVATKYVVLYGVVASSNIFHLIACNGYPVLLSLIIYGLIQRIKFLSEHFDKISRAELHGVSKFTTFSSGCC